MDLEQVLTFLRAAIGWQRPRDIVCGLCGFCGVVRVLVALGAWFWGRGLSVIVVLGPYSLTYRFLVALVLRVAGLW
jgi:hypothetical protein